MMYRAIVAGQKRKLKAWLDRVGGCVQGHSLSSWYVLWIFVLYTSVIPGENRFRDNPKNVDCKSDGVYTIGRGADTLLGENGKGLGGEKRE